MGKLPPFSGAGASGSLETVTRPAGSPGLAPAPANAAPGAAAAAGPAHPPNPRSAEPGLIEAASHSAEPAGEARDAGAAGESKPEGDAAAGEGAGEDEENGDGDDDDFDEEMEEEFGTAMPSEGSDPLAGYNRVMTGFNDKLYFWIFRPVASGYQWVLPEFARRGVANFFKNLLFPVRFVNNILQLKGLHAGEEFLRFSLNSTVGVLGLWDPAAVWFDLEPRDEDFGQTLGHYGVGSGPHIVLPFLGPSNLRDTLALVPDFAFDPISVVYPLEQGITVRVYEEVNYTSLHIGEYENLKRDALDLYPFLRDVYEQNRKNCHFSIPVI
ncbi:MAG: VacJ family lipoprotein [bacterium]